MSQTSNQPLPTRTESDTVATPFSPQAEASSRSIQDPHTRADAPYLGAAEASACGKIILCGEHAVVYGRPAIALPLADVRAWAAACSGTPGSGVTIDAPDLERRWSLASAPDHPLSELIARVLAHFAIAPTPDLAIWIRSDIPIAGGMGSGAAIATAIVLALARHLGREIVRADVSALVYASEQRFHGTPSGIDNTVVAYERPIWFIRRPPNGPRQRQGELARDPQSPAQPTLDPLTIGEPFTLLIGDTGVRSPTHLPVGEVRQRWQADPARHDAIFDAIGTLVVEVRAALARGDIPTLGMLLSQNHSLLAQLGVSSGKLDQLVAAACAAGALGAKLSGAGWGGVMIALVTAATRRPVAAALSAAGAARVLETTIERTHGGSLAE